MSRFKDRMCAFGSCRETFEYRWSGLGAKKYCKKHSKERELFRSKQYYNKNKDRCNAQSRQWLKDHPRSTWSKEQLAAQKKHANTYRAKNKERIAAYQKKWHQDNKERIYAVKKKWLENKRTLEFNRESGVSFHTQGEIQ